MIIRGRAGKSCFTRSSRSYSPLGSTAQPMAVVAPGGIAEPGGARLPVVLPTSLVVRDST